jgi:hypothetical protein
MGRQMQSSYGSGSDMGEIEHDLTFGKKIGKWMKGRTIRPTRMEIRTITHMEEYIRQVIKIIKTHGNDLSPNEITEISEAILKIRKSETIFKKGLNRINGGTLHHLEFILEKLSQIKPVFEKQAEIEKHILKLNKRKVDDLRKEKSPNKEK